MSIERIVRRPLGLVLVTTLFAVASCSSSREAEDVGEQQQAATLPTGFTDETLIDGLTSPTAMAFAPDGEPRVASLGLAADPTLGGHASIFYDAGHGPDPSLSIPAITTQVSGSTILVCVGRGALSRMTLPTDNKGNAYTQIGTAHNYTGWLQSGTAMYAASSAAGGSGHIVTVGNTASDEVSLFTLEIVNGGVIKDAVWSEQLHGTPITSSSVTTTGPATLVAFWWGDSGSGPHTAQPNNGFMVQNGVLVGGSVVQGAVATKEVAAAGTYNVTWTSTPAQGAQLWLVAVQRAAASAAPTVATPAAANPNPVTATTTTLSVLGADDGGEAALTYTWATTGTPPAAVAFSANGNNAAKSSTATFSKAGSYTLQATVRDTGGQTVTSSVGVTVSQTLTALAVTPANTSVLPNGSQQLTASVNDQFGVAMPSQPAFTWGVSGGGTIGASGLFTAGSTPGGPFTVSASGGGKNGTASVRIGSIPSNGLKMWLRFDDGSGTTAADASGNGNSGTLTGGATWSTDAAFGGAISLDGAGGYVLIPSLMFTGNFSVGAWVKMPAPIDRQDSIVGQLGAGQCINFHAGKYRLYAPNDVVIATTAATADTWQHYVITRSGSVLSLYLNGVQNATGTWTGTFAPRAVGRGNGGFLQGRIDDVVLYDRALSGAEVAQVMNGSSAPASQPPTVATVAATGANPVTGATTALSVLGADDGGEAALTYSWATTGTPPAAVTSSANGTNAAKTTTATFTKAGSYTLQATIRDANGLTAASSVIVTVNQTLSVIVVSPANATVSAGGTQPFTASAGDQFGTTLSAQPAMAWTVSGGGTMASSGLFTAGAVAGGPFTVTAASGGKSGVASVSVNTGFAVKINFQLATAPTYPGYLVDGGSIFGDRGNGFTYGWNTNISDVGRDRNAANSPDQRYDTLLHMQRAEHPNARWEIQVPNGTYSVRIVMGDPSFIDAVYAVDGEGVRVVTLTPNGSQLWGDGTVQVVVSDGRLTVSNGTNAVNNRICFIDIIQVPSGGG